MDIISVSNALTYGISLLVIGYVIYVMLHPDLDDKPSSALVESGRPKSSDADVLRWCTELWREAECDDLDIASVSGRHR